MKTVGVIGLGLIGGSMGLDLKARGFASRVYGVEKDPLSADAAVRLGLADEIVNLDVCVAKSDIIVVAVPVGQAVRMVPEILQMMEFSMRGDSGEKVVIDVCSTKEQICLATRYCPNRSRFVSTHPMAGTEYSGPWAAMPNLFDGRACIFANPEESDPSALHGCRPARCAYRLCVAHFSHYIFRPGPYRT